MGDNVKTGVKVGTKINNDNTYVNEKGERVPRPKFVGFQSYPAKKTGLMDIGNPYADIDEKTGVKKLTPEEPKEKEEFRPNFNKDLLGGGNTLGLAIEASKLYKNYKDAKSKKDKIKYLKEYLAIKVDDKKALNDLKKLEETL